MGWVRPGLPAEETTLTAHLNDIRVALAHLRRRTGATHVSLLGATVKHGRGMLNEVFWIKPWQVIEEITAPTLLD
jgi:hypothetical protein